MPQAFDRDFNELCLSHTTVNRCLVKIYFVLKLEQLKHVWTTVGKEAGSDESSLVG